MSFLERRSTLSFFVPMGRCVPGDLFCCCNCSRCCSCILSCIKCAMSFIKRHRQANYYCLHELPPLIHRMKTVRETMLMGLFTKSVLSFVVHLFPCLWRARWRRRDAQATWDGSLSASNDGSLECRGNSFRMRYHFFVSLAEDLQYFIGEICLPKEHAETLLASIVR